MITNLTTYNNKQYERYCNHPYTSNFIVRPNDDGSQIKEVGDAIADFANHSFIF